MQKVLKENKKLTDQEKKIEKYIKSIIQNNYTIDHTRNPIQKDSDNFEESSDKWLLIINKDNFDYVFKYYTGIRYRVYNNSFNLQNKRTKEEIESLRYANLTNHGFKVFVENTLPVKPHIVHIFYDLGIDSNVLDYTFKEWCDCLGYNSDSIKALEIYRDCQDNAIKLKNIGFDLNKLWELYQDY